MVPPSFPALRLSPRPCGASVNLTGPLSEPLMRPALSSMGVSAALFLPSHTRPSLPTPGAGTSSASCRLSPSITFSEKPSRLGGNQVPALLKYLIASSTFHAWNSPTVCDTNLCRHLLSVCLPPARKVPRGGKRMCINYSFLPHPAPCLLLTVESKHFFQDMFFQSNVTCPFWSQWWFCCHGSLFSMPSTPCSFPTPSTHLLQLPQS